MQTTPRGSSSSVRVSYPRLNRERIIQILVERLEELRTELPVVRVVLFGSYARGNYTAASDVDLLVVYRGGVRKDAYALVKGIIGIPRLEPHLYTDTEYERMRDTITKMVKDGIVLLDLIDSP